MPKLNTKVLWVGGPLTIGLLVLLAAGFQFDPGIIDSPLIGQPAPSFVLPTLEGTPLALEDLRSKPVVLNFWSTWCIPCIQEHRVFLAAARRHGDAVHFVGVIYQDDQAKVAAMLEAKQAWGPALIDAEGKVAIAYGVYGVPETYFIDAAGTIVEKVTGPVDAFSLEKTLGGLL